jgi:cytochrome c biogenesis protein
MAFDLKKTSRKIYLKLAAVKTGVILLITTSVAAALGTVILQRPQTEPDVIHRAYSPQVLAVLDSFGLTDVYHAWWFLALLALVSISIVFASLERWPNAWRFYARPYKYPESHFRAALPHRTEIPIKNETEGLQAAARALLRLGFRGEKITSQSPNAIFAERHRFAVMAVYVIHASLLLIFAGGLIDGIWGYRGYLKLVEGEQGNIIELRDRQDKVESKTIPFIVRCDETGQENYADGSPKKWWSKLAVVENGRDVATKEIVVNDPMVYGGVRLYQSGFGKSDNLKTLQLTANKPGGSEPTKAITLATGSPAQIDADTKVEIAQFIPDFYIQDNEVHVRSRNLNNPAIELAVTDKAGTKKVWIFPNFGDRSQGSAAYEFQLTDAKLANFTGLEVSFEPGQWLVWAGVILMGAGLLVAFYMVHMRFWIVPVPKEGGKLVLWVGGAFNKNRDRFEEFYGQLVDAVRDELKINGSETQSAQQEEEILAGAARR